MNKLLVTGLLCLTAAHLQAQKIEPSKVPDNIRKKFEQNFPGITSVKWEIEKSNYEANFMQGKLKKSALFNSNGQMTEDETAMSPTELPTTIVAYIHKNYSNAHIKEAAKIKLASGEVNYEAEVNGSDLLFDTKGAFIKAVKD